MRISFLELPESERRLYLEEAASRRGVSAVIIEKDFWVSWMLAVLFRSELAGGLVFKGGTSLSKVFGAIDRFSEDIDLSLAPAFVSIDAPDDDASRTRLDRGSWRDETSSVGVTQHQNQARHTSGAASPQPCATPWTPSPAMPRKAHRASHPPREEAPRDFDAPLR